MPIKLDFSKISQEHVSLHVVTLSFANSTVSCLIMLTLSYFLITTANSTSQGKELPTAHPDSLSSYC